MFETVTHGRSANGAGGRTVCGGKQRCCGCKGFQHIAARASTRCELVRCRRVEAGREYAEESGAAHLSENLNAKTCVWVWVVTTGPDTFY